MREDQAGDLFRIVKAFVFDMDGVITDTEALHLEAEQRASRELGLVVPPEHWGTCKGRTCREISEHTIATFGIDTTVTPYEWLTRKDQIYLPLLEQRLRPIPGAIEFLLKAHRCVPLLGLTTSCRKAAQEIVFNLLGLDGFFDAVVTAEDVSQGKPHPDPYLITAYRLGLEPAKCLVIEDSDNGIVSSRNAGCWTIGITTSLPAKVLYDAGANWVIESFEQLDHLIGFYRHEETKWH